MNNYIDDPVFGHMEYRHRWFKTDEYEMFGKKWTLTVAAKAYSGKPITDCGTSQLSKIPGESARNAGASFAKSN